MAFETRCELHPILEGGISGESVAEMLMIRSLYGHLIRKGCVGMSDLSDLLVKGRRRGLASRVGQAT